MNQKKQTSVYIIFLLACCAMGIGTLTGLWLASLTGDFFFVPVLAFGCGFFYAGVALAVRNL